jgi:TRAP-type C4-dicarboxylate transport system substrate-binding protein
MRQLSLILLTLCLWTGPLYADTVTLKIATISPDGTSWMRAYRAAAKQIEKETEGRVKLRYYPGGVMGNEKSVLRKIRIGQLQGGAVVSGGLAEINPDTQLYSLPLALQNYDEVDRVRKEFDTLILEKLKESGFISYGLTEGGFSYMMSDRKISSLEEAKGKKIWIPEGDRISRVALESLDISPVPLPITDVLTGLQTGLINTVAAPPTATIALQWHTRVKFLNTLPILYSYGSVVISEKALKNVSTEDQGILEKVFKKTMAGLDAETRKDNKEAMEALKKQGIAFYDIDPKEVDTWRHRVSTALDGLSGEQTINPDLVKRFREFIEKIRSGG